MIEDGQAKHHYQAEARAAEAQIPAIAETARTAGLLTEEEVVDLMGEDETLARTVVSGLRGGVVYHTVTRHQDGQVSIRRTGPEGEEPVPFRRPKQPN